MIGPRELRKIRKSLEIIEKEAWSLERAVSDREDSLKLWEKLRRKDIDVILNANGVRVCIYDPSDSERSKLVFLSWKDVLCLDPRQDIWLTDTEHYLKLAATFDRLAKALRKIAPLADIALYGKKSPPT